MSADSHSKIEAFKAQIQGKVQTLLAEFAEGKLNREQFHQIYTHYHNQMDMADQVLHGSSGQDAALNTPGATIAIRQAFMAKAIGLVIYHNRSGTVLDTLGDFDISPAITSPVLNDFSQLMESNQLIDRRVVKASEKQWVMFAAGRFTTIVTLFHNEPSAMQAREIERLHHDFEIANDAFLGRMHVDTSKLAYPFLVFVQQKLRKP